MSRSSLFQRAVAPAQRPRTHADLTMIEKENDAVLKALLQDVKALKKGSSEVAAEIKSHLKLLDVLGDAFSTARAGLRRTMSKLEEVGGLRSSSHMWLLFGFVFVVFIFIYFLLKFRR